METKLMQMNAGQIQEAYESIMGKNAASGSKFSAHPSHSFPFERVSILKDTGVQYSLTSKARI